MGWWSAVALRAVWTIVVTWRLLWGAGVLRRLWRFIFPATTTAILPARASPKSAPKFNPKRWEVEGLKMWCGRTSLCTSNARRRAVAFGLPWRLPTSSHDFFESSQSLIYRRKPLPSR
ncbi:hypothetical protein B0T25DRAFT_266637 [Lasiosphaeria hispida]|uniref:Uncharacterized protein n=1 Tax=Lasiosphaeria hispida TaxID=260671 RepID=A0AAJ0MAC5_9PEZI|nr:hypothetical protein B0T25DRAFT_266637 [Lasiosphaeria hispida]